MSKIPWAVSDIRPFDIVMWENMTDAQRVAAHKRALISGQRWARCPECRNYLREEVPGWAKCSKPENHGVKK